MSKIYEEYLNILADSKNTKQEEIFEWDNTSKTQPLEKPTDISSVVNQFSHVNISDAVKKFEGYELTNQLVTSNYFRIETPEQKLARIRAEIKELEEEHADVGGVDSLASELASALRKSDLPPASQATRAADGNLTRSPISDQSAANLNIEARLTKLETALGQDSINSTNLFTQVESVNKRLALLDPANMQSLHEKISQISMKMALVQKHTLNESQITKLNDMEKLVASLNDQVPLIPVLTDRLCSLKEAHERACLILNNEESNGAAVEKLNLAVAGQKKDLANLAQLVKSNSQVIKDNLKVLEDRIEKFCTK